ncbi:hypothetical protein [Oceanimonas smirnovii]
MIVSTEAGYLVSPYLAWSAVVALLVLAGGCAWSLWRHRRAASRHDGVE